MFRVFENLVQNGIKFTPEGMTPLVVVRARRLLGGDVEVCVRDFGCGMRTPESRALASRSGGHGIGLTTVARLRKFSTPMRQDAHGFVVLLVSSLG